MLIRILIIDLWSKFIKKKTIIGERSNPIPPNGKIILKGAKMGSVIL
jgi:hypothetical protein